MRNALIDLSTNLVVNVVEIEPDDGSQTPEGFLAVASDIASIGDGWDGNGIVPVELAEVIEQPQAVQSADNLAILRKDFDALNARLTTLENKGS